MSETAVREFVEEIRNQRSRFVFPESYTGRTLDSVIAAFAGKYIKSVVPHNVGVIISVLNWCSALQLPALFGLFIEQFTHPTKLNANYIKGVLVPLLPELKLWALQHNMLDTLAPAFSKIVVSWVDRVLGPSPLPNPALSLQLKNLARWSCGCTYCHITKQFLTTSPESSKSLIKIGAPNRKHVEQELAVHARGLATSTLIRQSPQGLTVSVTPFLSLDV